MSKVYLNGWTRETVLKRLEEKNGFKRCFGKVDGGKKCLYRQKTKACFVGAFIPDEEYKPKMEMAGDSTWLLKQFPHLHKFMPFDRQLMSILQGVHDDFTDNNLKERTIAFLDHVETNYISQDY